MFFKCFAVDGDVVDEDVGIGDVVLEEIHCALKCCWGVAWAESHYWELETTIFCLKGCRFDGVGV